MSFSSSFASELAFMDDSDEEQEEDEDMLLACVLVREYIEEKKKGQNFMLETEHFTIYKCMDAILDSELLSYKFPETEKELNEAAQGFEVLSSHVAIKGCVAC